MLPLLRIAEPGDVERLLPVIELFWQFEKLPFATSDVRGSLSTLLAHPEYGRVVLAELAGEIVAYAVLAFGYSLEHGGRDGLLDELYVSPQLRGQGLGTHLIEAVAQLCREGGVKRLHLEVDHTNPRAERLYARLGFAANDRQLLTRKL